MTFWQHSEIFSPILCRLLARHSNGGPLTAAEIAAKAKIADWEPLTVHTVEFLSHYTQWDDVRLLDIKRFTTGCGLDFEDGEAMNRAKSYIASCPTFRYLRTSPEWLSRYKPMILQWRLSYGSVTASSPLWPPLRRMLLRFTPRSGFEKLKT